MKKFYAIQVNDAHFIGLPNPNDVRGKWPLVDKLSDAIKWRIRNDSEPEPDVRNLLRRLCKSAATRDYPGHVIRLVILHQISGDDFEVGGSV